MIKIPASLAKRAKQIQVLLMDVDGTMTDGSVILLSQPDGTALEIKNFSLVFCPRRRNARPLDVPGVFG